MRERAGNPFGVGTGVRGRTGGRTPGHAQPHTPPHAGPGNGPVRGPGRAGSRPAVRALSRVLWRDRSLAGAALLAAGLVVAAPGAAQDPAPPSPGSEEEAVLEVIQDLFDAMAERDTARAAEILHPEGQFFRIPVPFEGDVPEPNSHQSFVENLAGPGPDLLERMEHAEALVHRGIASAWTPYDFYADGEFSHCGVNAFTLVRGDAGWRITGIVYTVEPDPDACLDGLGPGS